MSHWNILLNCGYLPTWVRETVEELLEMLKNYLNLSVIWSRTLKWLQTSTLPCFPQCKYSTLSTMLFQHARYNRVQMLQFMSTKQSYPGCRKLHCLSHCMVIPWSLCLSKEGCCRAKLSCHLHVWHSAILLHSLQGQHLHTLIKCSVWRSSSKFFPVLSWLLMNLLHKNCCAYRGDSKW